MMVKSYVYLKLFAIIFSDSALCKKHVRNLQNAINEIYEGFKPWKRGPVLLETVWSL